MKFNDNPVNRCTGLLKQHLIVSKIILEKLLASTRLLISAPIVVNISNLKMFKGAQAHNVQIEMILWDSCLSFNSKWRHSWNELKLICPQLDHSQSIQLSSGVELKYLKEIPQGQLQSNNQIKFGQCGMRHNSFILISHYNHISKINISVKMAFNRTTGRSVNL